MGINTKTNDFLTELTRLVNNCGLPACNIRLALDLVRNQVFMLEQQSVAQEAQAEKVKTEETENE